MISESTRTKLHSLAADLASAGPASSSQEWHGIAAAADSLAEGFLLDGRDDALELVQHLGAVAGSLSKGTIANPEAGVKVIRSLAEVLQQLDSAGGMSDSLRKQAAADAALFVRDSDREASRLRAASSFESGEQQEILLALEQRIGELEAGLLRLEPPVTGHEEVRSIFRQFHTLKGEGAICGITAVAEFCHDIETEIEDARNGGLTLTAEIVSVLQELASILRPILAGRMEEIGEGVPAALLEELRTAVADSRKNPGPQPEAPAEETFDDFFAGFDPPPAADEAGGGETEAAVSADETPAPTAEPEDGPPPAEERAAPAAPVRERDAAAQEAAAGRMHSVSVDVRRLDELLELVGEVSLLGSYITARLHGQDSLAAQTIGLVRACGRLQETANSLRMTSIRPLFMNVRRAAMDAARASRKMINIVMHGIDTQIDRTIAENLSAALIHIVRNAVDHGIEPADDRVRAGKPERGTITLSASRTSADIVIELRDDGRGFDLEAIRAKAAEMGRLPAGGRLTDEETADLVFLPGLSTAREVTGLSGRGVGMEIVRESIDNLRGRVAVRTEPGKGSSVRMRFPLMVTALDAMLVRAGPNILAIPVAQVRECFRPSPGDISTVEDRGTIVRIRGVILPVLFLGREFGIAGGAERPEDGVLVVVESGEMLTAVLVDETIGSASVVVRALEGPLARADLVSGAAILPDGSIGMVVDTSRLTECAAVSASAAFRDAGRRQAESSRQIDTVSIGTNQVGMIDFNILAPDPDGGTRTHVFAINAFKTREFVPVSSLRSVPGSPPGFAGIMMLRDVTVPVVHMGVVLGLMHESERRPEWEQIVLVCEFSGKTVGFLVSSVERVSYISWSDIMPPPPTGGLIQLDYVVGTILMADLKGTLTSMSGAERAASAGGTDAQVAFVLDFERIVGNVLHLYDDIGAELGNMGEGRKQGARILLAEDSPLIRRQTKKALSEAGITVTEAGDGQEAWETVKRLQDEAEAAGESIFSRVDLILSDIEMPRMDGYTLTGRLKSDPVLRVLPVLLHSSITNENMVRRAAEVEADGFVPKCDPRELAAQLRKYL